MHLMRRQQRLQGVEIVALNEHDSRVAIPARMLWHFFEQSRGHVIRSADILFSCQPVQNGHISSGFETRRAHPDDDIFAPYRHN